MSTSSYRFVDIAALMDDLRTHGPDPHPLHDYALPGPRLYYSVLEGA